jgi:hypothetical protein
MRPLGNAPQVAGEKGVVRPLLEKRVDIDNHREALQSKINLGTVGQIDRAKLQEAACSSSNSSDVDNKNQHQERKREREREGCDKTIEHYDSSYNNNESDENDKSLRPAQRIRVPSSYGDSVRSHN